MKKRHLIWIVSLVLIHNAAAWGVPKGGAQRLCLNQSSGSLKVRPKCKAAERALDAAALATLLGAPVQLFASVDEDGNLVRGTGVVEVKRLEEGNYEISVDLM